MEPLGASISEILEMVSNHDVWRLGFEPHGHERVLKKEHSNL